MIPCLNEENTVGRIIERIPRDLEGIDRVVALVIDTVRATAPRREHAAREPRSWCMSRTRGWDGPFRGVDTRLALGAEIMVQIDGDGQFDATDIGTLVAPILRQEADMVTASRFLDRKLVPRMPRLKRWGTPG